MTDRQDHRTDAEIDGMLGVLAGPRIDTDVRLAEIRSRVFGARPPARPRRRTRRIVVSATAVVVCSAAGAFGAAAAGVFDSQVEKAFSQTTAGYAIDQDSIVERVVVGTPDGGQAALYSASGHTDDGGPATCLTVLYTDAGVTPAGKPYRPQGGCSAGDGSASDISSAAGVDWFSTTGSRWKVVYGHTDRAAATAVFTDISGTQVSTPVRDGYLLVFVPETTPEQGIRGMTIIDGSGASTVLSTPVPYQGG